MFSIGLEFSLPKLFNMRRMVFGLGLAQVLLTVLVADRAAPGCWASRWQPGLALGGALAMSSTAIVSKLLAERMQLETAHGREIIGVLLFQDLAVVPLLILIPALAQPAEHLAPVLALALAKAAVVLAADPVRRAEADAQLVPHRGRRRSNELFVLNVLLITLGLAWAHRTGRPVAGAGRLRRRHADLRNRIPHQVEEDIKPFRDVLLGLFFVTIGMQLECVRGGRPARAGAAVAGRCRCCSSSR